MSHPPSRVLVLDEADPVGVAMADLAPAEPTGLAGVAAAGVIPRGHKIALRDLSQGETITKFGLPIGVATQAIPAGSHVHAHNLAFRPTGLARAGIRRNAGPAQPRPRGATFEGYVRPDGRVGTRNVLLVLATVNCSATVARRIAETFRRTVDLAATPTVEGVVALTHQHGCSVRADGPGMDLLRRTLGGYARHPNVGGVLVVGLGCEDNQVDSFLAAAGLAASDRLATRIIQDEGGTAATIRAGVAALASMLPQAAASRRTTVSADHLVVGLQCGGSDGFSAISANPALGRAADELVAEGGTVILSETPELYGAESLLLGRAADDAVAARLIGLLDWWEERARRDGGTLDNNPSPGNKEGGITTILEKSLGAVVKGGSSPLRDVLAYAEPVGKRGLVFMDSPGYDPVSVTGEVAGGANLVAFTTGRGSVFGCKPAPSIKLATNTPMFKRMEDDMDVNCGTILDGDETVQACGQRIFELMLRVASGEPTKSEEFDFGAGEFAPWVLGATM